MAEPRRVAGTGYRWRRAADGVVMLELEVAFDEWRTLAGFGAPTLAAVCQAGAALAVQIMDERAPERGGGAPVEG